jgi:hypothetical protein
MRRRFFIAIFKQNTADPRELKKIVVEFYAFVVNFVYPEQKYQKQKNSTAMRIPQNISNAQEVIANFIYDIPVVFIDSKSCLYFLIKELSKELAAFLSTGITEASELRVFSEEQEQALTRLWTDAGFVIKYRRQQMEYMHHQVIIVCPQVTDPATGMSITMAPWFLVPGRPFPVFVYLYMIWHYHTTGQKSQQNSAAAAGKLFGISHLHKSTVCRSIKAMEHFLNLSPIDRPLSGEDTQTVTDEGMIDRIPEIFTNCPSIELLEEVFQNKVWRLPEPVNHKATTTCTYALSGVPGEYAKVVKGKRLISKRSRDTRVRPTRPRKKAKRVQREIKFVEPKQIEHIRIGFIAISKRIIFDAAITYHRFLL